MCMYCIKKYVKEILIQLQVEFIRYVIKLNPLFAMKIF